MKKISMILVLLVALVLIPTLQFAQIGPASLSIDARRGWAWFLMNDHTQLWAAWEAAFIVHLEAQGIEYNKQRLEAASAANATLREKKLQLLELLRSATSAKIDAAIAALQ